MGFYHHAKNEIKLLNGFREKAQTDGWIRFQGTILATTRGPVMRIKTSKNAGSTKV